MKRAKNKTAKAKRSRNGAENGARQHEPGEQHEAGEQPVETQHHHQPERTHRHCVGAKAERGDGLAPVAVGGASPDRAGEHPEQRRQREDPADARIRQLELAHQGRGDRQQHRIARAYDQQSREQQIEAAAPITPGIAARGSARMR